MSQRKDTDYLTISARIRAMENRLLTRERMDRMIDAKDNDEAVKIITDCGYGELSGLTLGGLEVLLSKARGELLDEMAKAVPEPALVQVFQLKYDYHNAKVLIKAGQKETDPTALLLAGGRYDPHRLMEEYQRGEVSLGTPAFRTALQEGREILATSGDPQRTDFALDKACFAEMAQLSKDAGSGFLEGYVRLSVDSANLRGMVRGLRMNKGSEFLKLALLPGGNVSEGILCQMRAEELPQRFQGALHHAAELGSTLAVPGGNPLTAFECLCDNALMEYLSAARRVTFGGEVVVAYLYAREAELTTIRTILAGRLAGLSADVIRGRIRSSYV